MKNIIVFCLASLVTTVTLAQEFELKNTRQVYQEIQELQSGLRVLYLAAHPDDENTRLISWLENDQHIRTAYLSLTRGQGGQNLIGVEKGDGLGVIRSHELLAARSVDGAEQFFTRAIDFGYSKSATESFDKWGKQEVLHDVVSVIRQYRPHIIITRFPPNRKAGHGHHEASAILAEEAFDLAGDASVFPEQVEQYGTWNPTVLYWNASSWWDKSLDEKSSEELKQSKMHRVNIAQHSDLIGLGMNEIASLARSKHRCQAFGTTRARGQHHEYLQFVKGTWSDSLFAGMHGIWERSPSHAEALQSWVDAYDFTSHQANYESFKRLVIPFLAQRSMWAEARDMNYVQQKLNDLKHAMSGLRVEAFTGEANPVAGEEFDITFQVYNSSEVEREVTFKHTYVDTVVSVKPLEQLEWSTKAVAPTSISSPFWLKQPHDGRLYNIDKTREVGLPYQKAESVTYFFKMDGQHIRGESELHRKWRDRSIGEIIQPMEIVPRVQLEQLPGSVVLSKGGDSEVKFRLTANADLENIVVDETLPSGWEITNDHMPFSMKKGQSKEFVFQLLATPQAKASTLDFKVIEGNNESSDAAVKLQYEHIPHMTIYKKASIELKPIEMAKVSGKILYVPGSGDEVPAALEMMGYTVDVYDGSQSTLNTYKAVVTGIRAFNKNELLAANAEAFNNYVARGGHMVIMYNTSYGLKTEQLGPLDLKISRNRVTDENSEVRMLEPKHRVFSTPNRISTADFDSWVQERGLYFAGEWSSSFTPLIGWNDQGEESVDGGLLVGAFEKGTVVYTGISFFRQLPAGVPGAYRLMSNIIEYTP